MQLPWVPEDIFLSMLIVRGEAPSTRLEAPREKNRLSEPYQTASTVYFILGILSKDFWNQGSMQQEFESKVLGGYFKNVEEQVILPLFHFTARFGAIHSSSKTKK